MFKTNSKNKMKKTGTETVPVMETKETETATVTTPTKTVSMETPKENPRPQVRVERRNNSRVPYVRRYPRIIAGACEYCGTLDPRVPAGKQYTICPHYKNLELRCSYCDETRDPEDVIAHNMLNVAEHPDKPNTLVVWCNQLKCKQAHEKRFTFSG